MKRKTLSELKKSKAFYFSDLILYFIVCVIISLTLIYVFTAKSGGVSQGFEILYDNISVAEYRFVDGEFNVKNGYEEFFSVNGDTAYFYPDGANGDGSKFNVIYIDRQSKTARITEASCTGKDCTKQHVSESGGFIYCAPHKLKIIPLGLTDPVSG